MCVQTDDSLHGALTLARPGVQDAANIRLLGGPAGGTAPAGGGPPGGGAFPEGHLAAGDAIPSPPHREARERELLAAYNQLAGEDAKEVHTPTAPPPPCRLTAPLASPIPPPSCLPPHRPPASLISLLCRFRVPKRRRKSID